MSDDLEMMCLEKADKMIRMGIVSNDMDVFQLSDLLIKLEIEKHQKNQLSDTLLEYSDTIVSIEEVGDKETIDISVSGDNLFYCNNILTKNSFGLPHTADFMVALITTEELEKSGQIMVKQLKNRYNTTTTNKKFILGLNYSKMKFYDVSKQASENLIDANITNEEGFGSGVGKTDFVKQFSGPKNKGTSDWKMQ